MNKLRLFLENFIVYGLGGIINKIVPLIMVPIVTRLMPSSDYFGISDLSNTVVQFGSSIAIMGMYDAMYRMFFEKTDDEYKKSVCSTAFVFTLFTSFIVFFVMILTRSIIAQFFFSDQEYAYVVYLSAIAVLVGGTNSIISAPTRMQNKRTIYLIANTVSPVLSYSISIPLLLKGYYVVALPLAAVISGATMETAFGIMNRKWFNPRKFSKQLLKQLLQIGVPLLPNFLIYWIFNSSDKIMITNILGIGMAGIYSVSSKLGHASQLIYIAFAGGWQYFAFSTMNDTDQVKTNSMIFEYLGIISFIATSFICAWSYPIFGLLFTEQYLSGYIAAPYLFLAPLLQMLFQVACNQFIVIKKTWPNMLILSLGAIFNVILNYMLIPILGIEGASIATLVGYVISDVICVIVLSKMKLMIVSEKFVIACISMTFFMVMWRMLVSANYVAGTIGAVILFVFLVYLYSMDVRRLLLIIKEEYKK
ncbi:oligosaccharide flippase family protein [Lachnospiraceae bacterium 45-P1]